jgi:8-oxo-dGTP pyrophosphatase MutT (NUDIX family)
MVIETREGLQVVTDNRVSDTARAERAIADALPNGSPEKAEALVKMKQAELAARNRPGGFWIATSDPRVVKYSIIGEMPLTDVTRIALLTDGAARAVSPLRIYDWTGLLAVLASDGPEELIHQVRVAESGDPDATRWPRNKVHDDATAALVDFQNEASVAGPSVTPEPRPVVAAIVTSYAGVLIARRNDGKPPWTFIAGEIEPGESPADAAVREVKEETGLRIRAGSVIGRRVHPRTGRTMVYIAARPTHGTEAFVGDMQELAEVRWVSLAEADKLMGGQIFGPVRQHLQQIVNSGDG